MKEEELRSRLMALTSIAAGYCSASWRTAEIASGRISSEIFSDFFHEYIGSFQISVSRKIRMFRNLIISLNMSMRITMKVCDVQWKL